MNLNLIRKTMSDRWRSTAIYAGAIAAYLLMTTSIFPTFQKISGIQDIIDKYPKNLLKLFGVESFDIASFNNYVVIEFLSLIWVVIAAAYIIAFARGMVSGELSDGTMELLLAQPIERWKVLTSEGLVLLGGIVSVVVVTVLSIFFWGAIFGLKITYSGYAAFIPLGVVFFLAIAGYSIFFSAVFSDPRHSAMAAAGLTLVFYLVHFGGAYSKFFDKVDWFGIFHYYDPLKVLNSGSVPVKSILLLLAFAAVGFAAALWVFQRRDITTS
jgi:beta-exotoxin I transport system permease protein